MKRFIPHLALMLSVSLLTGCGAANSAPTVEDSSAQATTSIVNEKEDLQEISDKLDDLVGGDYDSLKKFVDANIVKASPDIADGMVAGLLLASETAVKESNTFLVEEDGIRVMDAVNELLVEKPDLLSQRSVIYGEDKTLLLDNLNNADEKNSLSKYLGQGLCMKSAEGSYYFDLDYPEYEAQYAPYIGEQLKDYFSIMSEETKNRLTIEEYLAVTPEVLGERAVAYERFLKNYPDSKYQENIVNLLTLTIWKLSYPSPVENLTDAQGRVIDEMVTVYKTLSSTVDCPVIQAVAKSVLDYIDAQPDGIVIPNHNEDAFSAHADKVNVQAKKQIMERYTNNAASNENI